MAETTIVYRGWIKEGQSTEDLEHTDALSLEPTHSSRFTTYGRNIKLTQEPIAEIIRHDLMIYGDRVDVSYYISDNEGSVEELQEWFIRYLFGDAEAEYQSNYSDYTGYLWTDENINVGGHDLLSELRSQRDKFCHLEITYHKD
jgi:hypothetical protein